MTIDLKVVEEKANKGEDLTKEETEALLKNEPAPEGYQPPLPEPEDMSPEAFDKEDNNVPTDKKEEKEPEKKPVEDKKEPEDLLTRVERELAKEEKDADLTGWTEREKAYYHQMRRDRKARQTAEAERDAAKFETSKLKKQQPAGAEPEKKEEPAEVDPLADLRKRDKTDFMTVEDVIATVERVLKVKPEETKKENVNRAGEVDPMRMKYLRLCESEAKAAHEDYEYVLELTDELVMSNPEYLKQIAQATADGENPAIKTYELIKGDPEFAKLYEVAKTRVDVRKAAKNPDKTTPAKPAAKAEETPEEKKKQQAALKAQEALEANKGKSKTTGHVEAMHDKSGNVLTAEEVASMTDREFAALPKKTRDMYLRLYG